MGWVCGRRLSDAQRGVLVETHKVCGATRAIAKPAKASGVMRAAANSLAAAADAGRADRRRAVCNRSWYGLKNGSVVHNSISLETCDAQFNKLRDMWCTI